MATTFILLPGRAVVELDAVLSETHASEVEVTEHPVERGANVSDHARVKPEQVTLEGLVSNTPVNRGATRRVLTANGVDFASNAETDAPAGAAGFAEAAYGKLREIKDARQLVTVATELRTYKNMVMTSLSVPRNARVGDALQFTAVFKEVRLAEVLHREVSVAAPAAKKAVDKSKLGASATPKASAADVNNSVIKKIERGAAGGDFGNVGKAVAAALHPPGAK
jgi:hypothetical protein